MKVWFTSDTHFGCDKLVEYSRPEFVDCEQHDAHLIDQINRRVARNDLLVLLGDFCKEKPGRYRPSIKCRHTFFILGNHDKEQQIRNVFGGNVWQQRVVKCGKTKVYCSHYPTAFWDGSHKGWYHAYGHIHFKQAYEAMMDEGLPGRRSMDVGVDAARRILGDYRPWSFEEMMDFLSGQKGHDIIPKHERWSKKDYGNDQDED